MTPEQEAELYIKSIPAFEKYHSYCDEMLKEINHIGENDFYHLDGGYNEYKGCIDRLTQEEKQSLIDWYNTQERSSGAGLYNSTGIAWYMWYLLTGDIRAHIPPNDPIENIQKQETQNQPQH